MPSAPFFELLDESRGAAGTLRVLELVAEAGLVGEDVNRLLVHGHSRENRHVLREP